MFTTEAAGSPRRGPPAFLPEETEDGLCELGSARSVRRWLGDGTCTHERQAVLTGRRPRSSWCPAHSTRPPPYRWCPARSTRPPHGTLTDRGRVLWRAARPDGRGELGCDTSLCRPTAARSLCRMPWFGWLSCRTLRHWRVRPVWDQPIVKFGVCVFLFLRICDPAPRPCP